MEKRVRLDGRRCPAQRQPAPLIAAGPAPRTHIAALSHTFATHALAPALKRFLAPMVVLVLALVAGAMGAAHAQPATPAQTGTTVADCTVSGHRHEIFTLRAPQLGRSVRVLVYLPPGYDCTPGRRYPVFYFNDGQDLFDWYPYAQDLAPDVVDEIVAMEARYGSWRLARQATRAHAAGLLPAMIMVGIASDGGARSRDLAPVAWDGAFEGRGPDHATFVTDTLVPAIDGRYRTIADRRCRGIGGSSLGGVSALDIGLTRPRSFAMVLALSPIIGVPSFADYLLPTWVRGEQERPTAFFVDMDDDRIGAHDFDWLNALVTHAPDPHRQVTLIRTPGGSHDIESWSRRIMPGLIALTQARCPVIGLGDGAIDLPVDAPAHDPVDAVRIGG